MKICTKCREEKSLDSFPYRNKAAGTRQSWCRKCCSAHRMERYYERYEKERDVRNAWAETNKTANKRLILEYLRTHPCIDCGEDDPIVLEFDHIDSKEKINAVSILGQNRCGTTVMAEIQKCEVRCANCHRRKTARDRGYYRSIM